MKSPWRPSFVKRNVDAGRLKFTLSYKDAVVFSDIIIICVGTPPKQTGEADLTNVFASAKEIGKNLSGYKVVVTKSTVPPGTNRKISEILEKAKPSGASFSIASCPEFLREGTAISDTLHPDRIIIGTTSDRAKNLLIELHKPIKTKLVICNVETAELIKYASNALLSTKISFANAIAFLSERVGADAEKVLEGVGLDNRLGRSFLYAGVGYGGSCFPKDVKALIALSKEYDYEFSLLQAVDEVNQYMRMHFVEKIAKHFENNLKGKRIALLGLSFKPDTDDMREAPSIFISNELVKRGAEVVAFDPIAMENAKAVLDPSVKFVKDAYSAVQDADAVAVDTEWNEIRNLDFVRLAKGLKHRVLFDGRNIYDPEAVKRMGYMYYGVGRM